MSLSKSLASTVVQGILQEISYSYYSRAKLHQQSYLLDNRSQNGVSCSSQISTAQCIFKILNYSIMIDFTISDTIHFLENIVNIPSQGLLHL